MLRMLCSGTPHIRYCKVLVDQINGIFGQVAVVIIVIVAAVADDIKGKASLQQLLFQ